MQRIDTSTAVANLFGAGKNGFRDGDPTAGVASTQLNAAIFNALQEELANIVEADGTALNPADRTQVLTAIRKRGGVASTITVYATPGTYNYVVPAGVYRVLVKLWGSGAGGAGSVAGTSGGGGGGAGGRARKIVAVTPGQSIPVIVPAGGLGGAAGANDGQPGATASFGAYVSATGGTPGSATNGNSSAGGIGVGGDENIPGGYGAPGYTTSAGTGGTAPGGGSAMPGGGAGGPGDAPGAGGTGGGTGATHAGYVGGAGRVVIEA